MVHESIMSCVGGTPLVELRRQFPSPGPTVVAKLELLNPSGSMKDRPARYIIEQGLRDGTLTTESHLVESSSGNFGIALAMAARVYRLSFTCVVDPKTTSTNLRILRSLGAYVELATEPDDQGCYLESRLRRARELCASLPGGVWINQYANQLSWQAHYHSTAAEILAELDRPADYLVVPVSTTGTILGLARGLRGAFPALCVVAVDAVGSVIFGRNSGPRHLPGLGAGRVPELLSAHEIDEVVFISDREAVAACRALVTSEGILAGGSSGAAVAAITKLRPKLSPCALVLTVLPDRGDRYLDLIYDDAWTDSLPEGNSASFLSPAH